MRSAFEDLSETTLARVAGIVGKIEYVASLRDPQSGRYSHWGLGRSYGEHAMQLALAEAHRLLFLRVLRTPLSALYEDVTISCGASKTGAGEYVEKLREAMSVLLPPDPGSGSARHFSSVLHALSSLISARAATPPGAIPPV